jgi:hypothetical protein
MTAADRLRNSTSFPKQEKEFWTQPISLYESLKLATAGDQNRDDDRVLRPAGFVGPKEKTTTEFS